MELQSPAFENGARMPQVFACDGKDDSPPLRIADVPDEAESMVLMVEDPDAPRGRFVHWLLWNLPPDRTELPEGLTKERTIDALGGAVQGQNGFGDVGWRGPCPPPGAPHHYRFQLYALDTRLDVEPGADRDTLQAAMNDHVIDADEMTGLYGR